MRPVALNPEVRHVAGLVQRREVGDVAGVLPDVLPEHRDLTHVPREPGLRNERWLARQVPLRQKGFVVVEPHEARVADVVDGIRPEPRRGDAVAVGDAHTAAVRPELPVVERALESVAHDLSAIAEVGAHVRAEGVGDVQALISVEPRDQAPAEVLEGHGGPALEVVDPADLEPPERQRHGSTRAGSRAAGAWQRNWVAQRLNCMIGPSSGSRHGRSR